MVRNTVSGDLRERTWEPQFYNHILTGTGPPLRNTFLKTEALSAATMSGNLIPDILGSYFFTA